MIIDFHRNKAKALDRTKEHVEMQTANTDELTGMGLYNYYNSNYKNFQSEHKYNYRMCNQIISTIRISLVC
jgi:hypothetical protein